MKPGSVVLCLGLFAVLAMLVTILTMFGRISSLLLFKISLVAGITSALAGLVLGVVLRFIFRKNPPEEWGQRRAQNGFRWSLVSVVIFFVLAAAIPGNRMIYGLLQGSACEKNIAALGAAAEAYLKDHGRVPDTLEDLVRNRYIQQIPLLHFDQPYQYQAPGPDASGFIITCPDTNRLLKDRGLLPPGKYVKIGYIQGKGLVAVTK